jgi:ATP-dependent Clp protease protease subunit
MIKKTIALMITTLLMSDVVLAKNLELTETNFVALTEDVNSKTANDVILGLEANKNDVVFLYINSPGGSIVDGIKVVNYLQTTKKKVHCIASYAASMAHAILQACPVRLGTTTNILLQHRAATGTGGNAQEIEATLTILKGLEKFLNVMESKRIGIPLEEYTIKVNPIWVSFGADSVKDNRVDEVVTVTCSAALYAKNKLKTIETFYGPVTVSINGCPILDPQLAGSGEKR